LPDRYACGPGRRGRLICRTLSHRGRKGERRSFAETDYAALLDAAHQRPGGPIVLIRNNLNTHISAVTRKLIGGREWLYVFRLPPYAPDLDPAEHVGSHLRRGLGTSSCTVSTSSEVFVRCFLD
jgi:hypothetical protein